MRSKKTISPLFLNGYQQKKVTAHFHELMAAFYDLTREKIQSLARQMQNAPVTCINVMVTLSK